MLARDRAAEEERPQTPPIEAGGLTQTHTAKAAGEELGGRTPLDSGELGGRMRQPSELRWTPERPGSEVAGCAKREAAAGLGRN